MKKALSVLLAVMLLLGVGGVGAGAEDRYDRDIHGTVEIINPGNALVTTDDYGYWNGPDLSGLVFQASGGKLPEPQIESYVEFWTQKPKVGKIVWIAWVESDNDAWGWKLGANQAILCVNAYQYIEFIPTRIINGVQYGTFESEWIFYGETPITLTGILHQDLSEADKAGAVELRLGVPAKVHVPPWEEDVDRTQWFKFTPAENGNYRFYSEGAVNGDPLWSIDGDYLYHRVDPCATLYDEDSRYLAYNDDRTRKDRNFEIVCKLKAGKTYYLSTYCSRDSVGEYTVTVETTNKKPPTRFSYFWGRVWHLISGNWMFGPPDNWFEAVWNFVSNILVAIFGIPVLPLIVVFTLVGYHGWY